ncbi:hypothetical protein NKG94_22175 [Micromonospora sp. M12]
MGRPGRDRGPRDHDTHRTASSRREGRGARRWLARVHAARPGRAVLPPGRGRVLHRLRGGGHAGRPPGRGDRAGVLGADRIGRGTPAGLPDTGWDAAIILGRIARFAGYGGDALCGLEVTIRPDMRSSGLGAEMLRRFHAIGRSRACATSSRRCDHPARRPYPK